MPSKATNAAAAAAASPPPSSEAPSKRALKKQKQSAKHEQPAWEKANWRTVKLGDEVFGDEDGGFMGLEELRGAEAKALFVASSDGAAKKKKTAKEEGTRKGETLEARLARLEEENAALRAIVGEGKADDDDASKSKKKKRKKKKKKAPASPSAPGTPLAASRSSPRPSLPPPPSDFDVSAWRGYGLCPQLLNALAEAKLAAPLPVQAATLPAALVARRDVLGAAPTGSGKTLAFGLAALQGLVDRGDVVPPPLLSNEQHGEAQKGGGGGEEEGAGEEEGTAAVLGKSSSGDDDKKQLARVLILCPTRELALQVSAALRPFGRAVGARVAPLVGGISPQKQARLLAARPAVVVGTPGRLWDAMSAGMFDGGGGGGSSQGRGGGRSGRSGSGGSSGAAASPYLQSSSSDENQNGLRGIRFLVVDEADRMAESGRFEELSNILGRVYGSVPRQALQTLVFSATLTLPHAQRGRVRAGKGGGGKGGAGLEELVEGLRLRPKPAVVDLCAKAGGDVKEEEGEEEGEEENLGGGEEKVAATAKPAAELPLPSKKMKPLPSLPSGVSESFLELPDDEARDAALYSLLATTKGRALVFVNAVSAARRLVGLLRALRLPAKSLHAGMQQRARLKALDAFKRGDEEGDEAEEEGEGEGSKGNQTTAKTTVLVATDVAARGLDIPSVSLVVHYQVPPAADVYVHRCGRTGRGVGGQGLALSLVTPRDSARFAALMRSLGRGAAGSGSEGSQPLPPPFPLDRQLLSAAAKRVRLASRVDVAMRAASKASADDAWRRRLAAEAEIELSDDDDDDDNEGSGGGGGGGGSGGPSSSKKKRCRNGLSAIDAAAAARLDALLSQSLQPKFSSRFFAGAPAPSMISGGGGAGSKKRKAADGDTEGEAAGPSDDNAAVAVAATVGLASTLAASRAAAAVAAVSENKTPKSNESSNGKRKRRPAAPVTVAELRAAALARALERRRQGSSPSASSVAAGSSRRRGALVVVNPTRMSIARGAGDALAAFKASQQQQQQK